MRDTAFLFSLCGLAGFTIVFFVPAALQYAARRISIRRWGDAGRDTPHSTCLSGTAPVVGMLTLGSLAFAYNVWVVLIAPALAAIAAE